MFIIDFDDTLFDTHAMKKILTQSRELAESELAKLLLPDAFLFLHYLKTSNHKLILLSLGDLEFQNKKINATGIANFFDEIIITPDSKELILEKILKQFDGEKDIWFVNDKIKETKKIIQYHPKLKPILKMSPMFAKEEYELSQMPHFSTLTQIQQYVEQQIK